MKKWSWYICVLIVSIFFLGRISFAAELSVSNVSGTVSQGNTLTVSGANFGTKVTGDFSDYFDGYPTPWICNSLSCSAPGNWDGIDISSSDVTRRNDEGYTKNLAEISTTAGNYSTGAGFRKMVGYHSYTYGMYNTHIDKVFGSNVTEFWLRFYMKWGDANDPWPTVNKGWLQSKNIWIRVGNTSDTGQLILSGQYYTSSIGYSLYKITSQNLGSTRTWSVSNKLATKYRGSNKWIEVRIRIKMETSSGANNGEIEYYFNGLKVLDITNANLTSESILNFYRFDMGGNIIIVKDNTYLFNPGQSAYIYYDDVTVVKSYNDPGSIATVYLSNNATWGSGVTDRWNGDSNFIRQKVGGSAAADYGFKSWSNTQCKFEVNLGTIDTNEPVYLYVTNWNGETNSSGFNLVVGLEPAKMKGFEIDKIQ